MRKNLPYLVKISQVSPGIILTRVTRAIRIKRPKISGVPGVSKVQFTFMSKNSSVSSDSRRETGVEHIDAQSNAF